MKRVYLLLMAWLAVFVFAINGLAAVSATIDRNQIALDETVNLSINLESGMSLTSPDLSSLEKDFRIVGKSQSSNAQYVNGALSTSTNLVLSLAPKRAGILKIPPITIGKEQTEPLQVKVLTQAQPKTRADQAPIFIETDLDKVTVPVQAQLIYSLRIYWGVEANISDPADPQIKDALVERLDDATFNKTIGGRQYNVFERKFAIFPQKSGALEIPQIVVVATVADRQRRGTIYDFFGTRGRAVKLRSEPKSVTVLEKPAEYPVGKVWLPTDKLSIGEDWSEKLDNLQTGESVTLNIALAGQGLLAAQLPPVELDEIEGLKIYQGKANTQNLKKGEGITGIRQENIAIIPVRAGRYELPEIRIPWWNLKEGKVEYAVLPARQLTVKQGGAVADNPTVPSANIDDSGAKSFTPGEGGGVAMPPQPGYSRPLIFLAIFLASAWLVTLFILIKTRRELAELAGTDKSSPDQAASLKEKDAFRKLRLACRANDALKAKKALLDWVSLARSETMVRSVDDLVREFPNTKMGNLLEQLDRSLYGGDEAAEWQGSVLLEELESIRSRMEKSNKRKKSGTSLTSLYK